MSPSNLPRHSVFIRWGTFRLDLVGRVQIIAAVSFVMALFGLRFFL